SLPMGAGKTYLMAAFIYLDLYFCHIDPTNTAFARNFVVFAPSGLKSSVIPSLKTIREFDPSWVIPEPAASELRASLSFEVLDEQRSASKSNRAKNPNVQKVAIHQPFQTLRGLVLVTNAEKVILSNVKTDSTGNLRLFGDDELDEAGRIENELRDIIGKLPGLAIIIDEVHHAQNDDIKLRAVVSRWATTTGNVNCVLGFSGTPYLQRKAKVELGDGGGFRSAFMANVVNYYPLAAGIGNFLKRPTVKIVDGTSDQIIRAGVERFLDDYGCVTYANGTVPKLAIFCGTVIKLEEEVAPLVAQVLTERGLDPDTLVLKYHRGGTGSKRFPTSPEWGVQFAMLDSDLSRKRIVLLAQIGKEGWDCRSLAGVILSQEGDCSRNMVLQTSCRCLREVVHGEPQTALIVLNDKNALHLERQLKQTQRIDLKTFQTGTVDEGVVRHSRVKKLGLPRIDHVRFELSREMVVSELEVADIEQGILDAARASRVSVSIESVENLDFSGAATSYERAVLRQGATPISYRKWKHDLLCEAGPVPASLERYAASETGEATLRVLFGMLTQDVEGVGTCYRPSCDQPKARSVVRSLFYPRREVRIDIEEVKDVAFASFVDEESLTPLHGVPRENFYPDQQREAEVLAADEAQLPSSLQAAYDALMAAGQPEVAAGILTSQGITPAVENTYQYIPYRFDSPFEQTFYQMVMGLGTIKELGLEVYYNGDNAVADFRIDCFKKVGSMWKKVGKYTPDFLIVRRDGGSIDKILIVETKGLGYSRERSFVERREFMEHVFVPQNNTRFGRARFDYRVLTDDHAGAELRSMTDELLRECFG
ncbi:MAG: DEAD/DEAH box helicase family protein, partial [Coriobacteriales bacterium]|nr:DEAD/DEAH box helicase family protein [Coriobacteriales bacterium]